MITTNSEGYEMANISISDMWEQLYIFLTSISVLLQLAFYLVCFIFDIMLSSKIIGVALFTESFDSFR
jgi:hypothetical protein